VKITADTNVLVRALVQDDPEQARAAAEALEQAELVAVPLPDLCELVWVLRRVYQFSSAEWSNAIRALISSRSVVVDRPAVELGLSLLDAGGDFADGVIAMAESALGGDQLVTFDRQAAALLERWGQKVVTLWSWGPARARREGHGGLQLAQFSPNSSAIKLAQRFKTQPEAGGRARRSLTGAALMTSGRQTD
jgi:predicted nucleic-acid-binding protein